MSLISGVGPARAPLTTVPTPTLLGGVSARSGLLTATIEARQTRVITDIIDASLERSAEVRARQAEAREQRAELERSAEERAARRAQLEAEQAQAESAAAVALRLSLERDARVLDLLA